MHIPHTLIVKLLLAIAIGGIIGLERELRSKSAGFRTMILICLGATLFTVFSVSIGAHGSPDRIAANVVVGIGFLGAGVILRTERSVHGLTTAASIWLAAALGMGIGAGYFQASILGCVVVTSVLFLFSTFDSFLDSLNQQHIYSVSYYPADYNAMEIEKLLQQHKLNVVDRSMTKKTDLVKVMWVATGSSKNHQAFIQIMLTDPLLREFEC